MTTIDTPEEFVEAFKEHKSIKEVWRQKNNERAFDTTRKLYLKAVDQGLMDPIPIGGKSKKHMKTAPVNEEPVVEGRLKALRTKNMPLPPAGQVNRYLFSCIQNNTQLHEPFWDNLMAFLEHLQQTSHEAQLHLSAFTYVKSGLGARGDKANITGKGEQALAGGRPLWFDPRTIPYHSNDRIEIAPGLIWCGEMNILPTAVRPLSGMDSYTGRQSSIFPHTKIAMTSIASEQESDPTKLMYTTGTVTMRNYIQKKAGLKAEFHHAYAALLVEVDEFGNWWCRQVNADSEGTFYDLDVKVEHGTVTTGQSIEAITWGDIHMAEVDWHALSIAKNMKHTLQPRVEFMGDVLDFRARPWQEIKDPHRMFQRFVDGEDSLHDEVAMVARFIETWITDWCETVFVYGNHEAKLGRWLKEADGRRDPVNAEFWLTMQSATYAAIRENPKEPNYLQLALETLYPKAAEQVTFLRNEEGYVICPDNGGIQCGKHGHLGPRGRPGSPEQFAKLGRKMNLQHFHAAGIIDGCYVPGVLCTLNPDWTNGSPSDWSHSVIPVYPNGKRAIVTFWAGQWAAGRGPSHGQRA